MFATDLIMKHRLFFVLYCCALSLIVSGHLHAEDGPKTVLVHYMSWYASKPVSGHWGWHWTMNHFNPDKVEKNGRREVASHYYPLIGPYDSNDPHALECHVLLMKFAGIDGAIVDWYGIKGYYDYAVIHRNTGHLLEYLKKAGLKFAVCYEDQTVKHMIKGRVLKKSEDVAHGTEVMDWLHQNWFGDEAYLRVDGKPVILVFGPQHFRKEQWAQMTSGLAKCPLLYALSHLSQKAGADGAFGWPPVHGGREIVPAVWRQYLRKLYARGKQGESVIAPVFPKFHDIYQEAGLHESYGYLDDRDGKTFEETLEAAWQSNSRVIQIATWNDYGEGTIVEPTVTFGYRYLEAIQKRMKLQSEKPFPFDPDDLRLPVKLYKLRKQSTGDQETMENLNKASALMFSSECDAARTLLAKCELEAGEQGAAPDRYSATLQSGR
ncbi:glycoside hydrolase family 99-like domain-containing protein [bacterium]|nr:glycoside hydrolase family 99-like domain-containing protein [bacterium]